MRKLVNAAKRIRQPAVYEDVNLSQLSTVVDPGESDQQSYNDVAHRWGTNSTTNAPTLAHATAMPMIFSVNDQRPLRVSRKR